MQLQRIDLRTGRIGEEHDRFYRRPASVLIRECLTPAFTSGGLSCIGRRLVQRVLDRM